MKRKKIVLCSIGIFLIILSAVSFFVFGKKKIYLTLNGTNTVEVNYDETYKEDGFKAEYCNKYMKIFCKDITDKVKVETEKVSNKKDNITYDIQYNNEEEIKNRVIEYKDLEEPVITLVDNNTFTCPNKDYVEEGYSAIDNVDGDITDKVIVTKENDKVIYSVEDSSGNKKVVIREIKYKDTTPPNISLSGGENTYVYINQNYNELGYNVSDNCDENVFVTTDSNIDTSKTGNYEITYNAIDSSGNKKSVKRKVTVYDDTSQIPKNGRIVYITFDDGPGPYTKQILDILDRYNIKVTFFVTHQFSNYEYLIKEEYEKGHAIAVHTYTHRYENVYSSVDSYINDFNMMNDVIFNQTGIRTKLFRFPGGSSNKIKSAAKGVVTEIANKMTELGYTYFDWNVDSNDVSSKSSTTIYNNVVKGINANKNSVVLMHDINKLNIESIEMIINYGLNNGFTFLPLTESSPTAHHHINN